MNRIDEHFIKEFRRKTEAIWKNRELNLGIYGFQIQTGTRWNTGLSENDIKQYEHHLDLRFPDDFRLILRHMNGTDLPTLNVYGTSGEPHAMGVGVFSFPRDSKLMKKCLEEVARERSEIRAVLKDDGFNLDPEMGLIPFFPHRYLVSDPNLPEVPVLSIVGTDAIVYAPNFRSYLESEFLKDG